MWHVALCDVHVSLPVSSPQTRFDCITWYTRHYRSKRHHHSTHYTTLLYTSHCIIYKQHSDTIHLHSISYKCSRLHFQPFIPSRPLLQVQLTLPVTIVAHFCSFSLATVKTSTLHVSRKYYFSLTLFYHKQWSILACSVAHVMLIMHILPKRRWSTCVPLCPNGMTLPGYVYINFWYGFCVCMPSR